MKEFDLTARLSPSTLEGRGLRPLRGKNIFMPESGQGEVQHGPEVKPTLPSGPFTSDADQIENQQLRNFATDFQNRIKENPLSSWSTEDLRSEYLRLSALTAKLSSIGEFAQRERVSADAAPLSRSILEQLGKRGIDLEELFLESVEQAEEAVTPIRSIGAATLTPADFPDPMLQNIASELNAEINRVGAGNPLNPIYIDRQINRVQGLIDRGQIDAAQANRLLGELNTWMAESIAPREDHEEEGAPREEMDKLNQAVRELLTDEAVIRVMTSDNPDFTAAPQLEAFINEYMDPGDMRGNIVGFAKLIASQDSFSEISRRILFERLLEKIISMPDETPDSPYASRTGNLYVQTNLQGLLTVADSKFHEHYSYFANLVYVREVAHELNRNIKQGELYKKFVTESLRTSGLDFMHNGIAGVNAVIREYERISSNMVSRGDKTWFSEKEIKGIDSEVIEMIKTTAGEIRTDEGRPLTEWELNRALLIGKILFAGSQRMAMYAGLGDLPSDAKVTGRIGSLAYEYIVRTIFPFKTIAPRFFAGAGGPKRFMERIFKEQEAQLNEDKTLLYPIFGLDKRTILMDTCGALDSQSHSWRAEMMFLGAINMNIDDYKNLLEYLNKVAKDHGGALGDPILGGKGVTLENRTAFSKDVAEVILGQRLYLSVLARYGNFDNALKADIWKKISLLTPSTIVSIVPNAIGTSDKPTWEGMRHKLYAAENRRIGKDATSYKNGLDNTYLQTEHEAFKALLGVVQKDSWTADDFNKVLNYMGMSDAGFSEVEKNLLQKIVKKGFSESSELSSAKLPFNFAIVDAPRVAWAKTPDGAGGLDDADLLRILLSDQQSFSEAWGEINTLIEHPTTGLREHMKKAVGGIGMVIGRHDAQKTIRPFIIAYHRMASTYRLSEWIGFLQKIRRQPTSEMEEYYRESHISWEANEREISLEGMAQDGSISDDISEKRVSDLDIVKKRTRSTRGAVMGRIIRLVLLLLGPEAGLSFLKILLPEDLLRSLQKK